MLGGVRVASAFAPGLSVGMQLLGRHHEDALLFDVALTAERTRPWPLVALSVAMNRK